MNNKGLLNYSAAVVCVFMIIYFLMFSFIVSSVHDAFPDDGINDTVADDYMDKITAKLGTTEIKYCDSPRYKWTFDSSTQVEMKYYDEPELSCSITRGIKDGVSCEYYDGCDWENITEGGWLWGLTCYIGGCTEIESCTGNINVSSFDIDIAPLGNVAGYDFDDYNFSDYENTVLEYIGMTGFEGNSVCKHPNVILNDTNCDYFECTWTTDKISSDKVAKSNKFVFFDMIFNALSFSHVFGFADTTVNLLMAILFIYIPLIVLIVSGIYAVFGGSS